MNWALEHVQLVIAIVVAVGALIKKIGTEAQRGAKKPNPRQTQTTQRPQNRSFDSEAAERTRKLQEEIRKKIEDRRRAQAPVTGRPPDLPSPGYDPFTPEALQRQNPTEVPRPPELSRAASERALVLARKLEAAKQREEKRRERAKPLEDTISIKVAPMALIPSSGPLMPISSLRDSLFDPDEVRRAVVLSEILQPPLGLR